ncbi:MAG: glycosyl transferase [Acidobacteria bacterium]|nr:MAG: glycosyl transferase [Acidobacteriota bacterium]
MNPSPAPPQFKTLSIIIPCYNEKETIEHVIESVMAVTINLSRELIIVDDCSKDGTREILQELKAPAGATLRVLMHDRNQGKGAAIRTGLEHVTGDIVLVQDADLEYDPSDFPALLVPILAGRADVVFGNRFHGGAHRVLYFWHYQANLFLTTLCNLITNLNLSDMEVGYKVFRSEFIKKVKLTANRFGFEPEITIKAARLRCRIYEVPISYHGRTYEEGKKITWRDGVAALYFLVRFGIFG